MNRSLRLAPTEQLRPLELRAVQAVLRSWRGKDWLWHGDNEMARFAVEACRTVFETYREVLEMSAEGVSPELGAESVRSELDDGGSAA